MNNINLFLYSGNLYKKTLEKFIAELKVKVNDHLENNDLNKAKELIKQIEEIRAFQSEVNKLAVSYTQHYENQVNEKNISVEEKNKNKIFINYSNEILQIIKTAKEIKLYEMKVALYNENYNHLRTEEISNNEIFKNLLNWEVCFYRSLDFLIKKEFIEFDDDNYFTVTEKGDEFYGEDYSSEDIYEEIQINDDDESEGMLELVEQNNDIDLITAIHTYILSNLIEEGIIENISHFDQVRLFVAKEIYTLDEKKVNKWEEIEIDKHYMISSYLDNHFNAFLIKDKIEKYHVLDCIDDDELTTYFAFI